jgi:signal transduction histidine kinase
VPDAVQPELQADRRKIEVLERKIKLLEEGLRQAERLRQMYDQTAQELKVTKSQLLRQSEELEEKVQERTQQLLEAQEELVRKEKLALLGQVADTVGHELRNPLGVMNNAVYFLQAVLPDADEAIKEYLGIIKEEIVDAERIVSDLLDAVRIKPPRPDRVDIAEVIGQTLRKCDIPPSITVSLDVPVSLSAIRADPMHLHQIFWNLVTNGLEAMPEGGALAIRLEEDQTAHTLRISVKDSGMGITPEQQAKLFQPMFTTKARRIGLGLVVVKNLVQVNGGSVSMESYPGTGSTFTVTLPNVS